MRGVHVLEVGSSIAGAYCARLFVTAGADVVLLEPPGSAGLRSVPPWIESSGRATATSATHEYLDAGKRSASVDMDSDDVDTLLAWADLVISGCDGEPEEALRFHQRVAAANPAAVHVVVSGYGLSGPYARWRHSSLTDWAAGGYLYLNGDPTREPLQGGGPWASYVTGATAAIGAQAALFERARTGHGQLVDVGAMEAIAAAHQWSLTMYTHTGVVKRRWGERFGESHHPMALYRCSDGWICIGAASREQWERLCIVTDQVELLGDERLNAPGERFDRADEIDGLMQPWLSARTAEEAVEELQAERVPSSLVLTFADVLGSEQLVSRAYWAHAEWLGTGAKMPRAPFQISGVTPSSRPAPSLGADTDAVLAEAKAGTARAPLPRVDLAHVKMLEFTIAWAGPLAGRFMADLGMDVVKVEHPARRGLGTSGKASRHGPSAGWRWGALPDPQIRAEVFPNADPGERWWNRMGLWNKMNRNKKSLCLDAKTEEGNKVLSQLIERTDVVVHNFTPRGAASLGVDRASVARHNGRAVTVSMTGYGETGPMATHSSYGPILEAYSGFDEATGYLDGGPMRLGIAFPDAVGGLHGAFAILAGLWERELTGRPVHVDLSQLEALLSVAGESLLATSLRGAPPARSGNRSLEHAPQGVYRCAGDDAWIAVSVRSDDEWRRLQAVVNSAELLAFGDVDVAERRRVHDAIDDAVTRWSGRRSAQEAAALLQGAGLAASPAFTNRDLVENEHLAARGFMVSWEQTDVGPQTFPGFPIHFATTSVQLRGAPALGAHNAEVLASLGYDLTSIERLRALEVISDHPPR